MLSGYKVGLGCTRRKKLKSPPLPFWKFSPVPVNIQANEVAVVAEDGWMSVVTFNI
jgi:hypothetical protein